MYIKILMLFSLVASVSLDAMKQEPVMLRNAKSSGSLDNFFSEPFGLGGVAAEVKAVQLKSSQDELVDFCSLLGAVMPGVEVHDKKVVLPGRCSFALEKPGHSVSDVINQVSVLESCGKAFVHGRNATILQECQNIDQHLWHFISCVDLPLTEIDSLHYKKLLHRYRMLSITALISQIVALPNQYGKAPVSLPHAPTLQEIKIDTIESVIGNQN